MEKGAMSEFLTKKQARELVLARLGVPVGDNFFEIRNGLQPAARYGKFYLYRPDDVLAHARARMTFFETSAPQAA
jgi:hypothetical protein